MSRLGDQFRKCLEEIGDPDNQESYLSNVEKAVTELGFAHYAIIFGRFIEGEAYSDNCLFFNNYGAKFSKEYRLRGYLEHDLGLPHAANNTTPIFWSDLDAAIHKSTGWSMEKEAIEYAARFGITYGLTIPAIFHREPLLFGMSLVGSLEERDAGLRDRYAKYKSEIDELFRIAHYACPVRHLAKKHFKLNEVDLIILRMKAKGVSNADILEHLNKKGESVGDLDKMKKRISRAYEKIYRRSDRYGPKIRNPPTARLKMFLTAHQLLES